MRPIRAISIRQPFVELILQGKKKHEYRSRPTNIRERVMLYASLRPVSEHRFWKSAGKEPGELPVGKIVGTVEIVGCRWYEPYGCYAYKLARPKRLRKRFIPKGQPTPLFWRPKF